jgi:DNA uptake protein ComE-like DNA-binding protein
VLAARIIKYRERIGGFTGVAQVKRTYGISDSVFALIGPMLMSDPSAIPKIDLNTVSAWQLVQRTGIPDAAARAIIAQRRQTGSFQSVEELKKIPSVDDSLFQKMLPFVKVN